MGRSWGNCDFRGLEDFQKKLNRLARVDFEKFCNDISKQLAARLLGKVIRRTPVGDYTGGGQLRQAWTTDNQTLVVEKIGTMYQIFIVNTMDYASYVEYGHRTRGGAGWVEGQFFLTASEQELNRQTPNIVNKLLEQFLKGVLND